MRQFTEEQTMFRDAYRRFLESEVAPRMPEFREAGIVDREIFRKAGEKGFLMVWPDEKYGGMGDSGFRFEQIIIEETQRARCADWYNTLHSRLVGPYIDQYGSDEQKMRLLPGCVRGEKILAIAMTEPDAGSDLAGMRSSARDCGEHYLLNGSKTYISNGINADYVIVAAKLDGAESRHAMVLLIVDHCVAFHNAGELTSNMAAKAKLLTAEIEWKMVDLGVQLHGGAGYMMEYDIATLFTDARVDRIDAGTSEIMKLIIGRDLFSDAYLSILD